MEYIIRKLRSQLRHNAGTRSVFPSLSSSAYRAISSSSSSSPLAFRPSLFLSRSPLRVASELRYRYHVDPKYRACVSCRVACARSLGFPLPLFSAWLSVFLLPLFFYHRFLSVFRPFLLRLRLAPSLSSTAARRPLLLFVFHCR